MNFWSVSTRYFSENAPEIIMHAIVLVSVLVFLTQKRKACVVSNTISTFKKQLENKEGQAAPPSRGRRVLRRLVGVLRAPGRGRQALHVDVVLRREGQPEQRLLVQRRRAPRLRAGALGSLGRKERKGKEGKERRAARRGGP